MDERKVMIDQNFEDLSIRDQCDILGVNRSGYYYKSTSEDSQDQELMNIIHEIWLKYPFYGYRKIKAVLERDGYAINHKKVQRLMQTMDLQAIYQKPNLSKPNKQHLIYPYLLGDLKITKVNQVWVTDLTYIKMPEGFVYLLAIMDLYSRFIVSGNVSISMEAEFCVETLEFAMKNHDRPEIFNTDQGSQFTSNNWVQTLLKSDVKISMDGKGRCFDNIYIERFWRTVKYEEVYLKSYETVTEARLALMNFIEFYNHKRPQQNLGYKTPSELYFGKK